MPGTLEESEAADGGVPVEPATRTFTPIQRQSSYSKAVEDASAKNSKSVGDDDLEEEGLVDGKKKKEKPEMVPIEELFRYATGLDHFLIFVGIVAALIHGGALPGVIFVLGEVLDEFIKQSNYSAMYGNDTEGLAKANADFESQISIFAWVFGGLAMLTFIVGYIQTAAWYYSGIRQVHAVRRSFFRSIIYQEMGWFDTHNTGELVSRLSGDMIKIQQGLGEKNGLLVQWLSSAIVGIVMGFVQGPLLALVVLACTPLLAIAAAMMSKLLGSYQNKEQGAYAKAGSVAEEVLSSVRTVVAFGGEDKEVDRYTKELESARKLGNRKGAVVGFGTAFVFVVMFSTYGLAFWWGSQLIIKDKLTPGDMLTTFFAVLIGGFALGHAAQNSEGLSTGRGAAVSVYRIINKASLIDASATRGKRLDKFSGDISFENVGFTYPSRPDTKILTKLDLRIPSGKTVAIVGASGCGKSTIVQLIQRMYDPDHGTVQLDGEDIREYNLAWLRSQIGVVSQEPLLFAATIKENIMYGLDRGYITQDEVEVAATAANAHSFIMDLPHGYDTLVGERGSQLSGGQKQRVAIARALIRNPRILLLDEATSALDTESEGIVQEALDKARLGRTTVVIAHRLSTVRNADLIVAIDNGEVNEIGTHDELMTAKGIYYTLVTMQTFLTEARPETLEDSELALGSLAGEVLSTNIGSPVRQISLKDEAARFTRQFSKQTSTAGSAAGQSAADLKRQPSTTAPAKGTDDKKKPAEPEEEEDDEFKDAKGPTLRLLRDSAPEWWALLIAGLGALVQGATMPAFALLFSRMLEIFSIQDKAEFEKEANFWSGMFPVLGLVSGLTMFLNVFFFTVAGEGLTKRMRRKVFRCFLHKNMDFFDDPKNSTGSLSVRLSRDAALMQQAGGKTMGQALAALTTLVAALVISFTANVYLTLVIMGLVPVIAVAGYLQMKTLAGHEHSNKDRLQDAGKIAVETIENIRTVVAFGLEKRRFEAYMVSLDSVHTKEKREAHTYGLMTGFGVATIFTIYAVSFRFGGYLIAHQGVAYGDVFKVFSALVFSAMSLGQGTAFAGEAGKGGPAAARIYSLLDGASGFYETTEDLEKPDHASGTIELEDVDFTYPSRPEKQVLNKLSLSAKEGETVALVGTSGCGKSTSVSLLERFYDVQSGIVKVSGYDVTRVNVRWLRQQMGIVQQEPVLFDSSIADNIAYGALFKDIVTQGEIEEAARKANIHTFIVSLPQGYETNVGPKGTQLSGGQKQRVAIARALIRNPRILLLDEATSALDTESEK
eukprot:scpid23728/ scgid7858/ Multidrug resistance protein 1A; ATP-binding cassette sub-family B member 1A; MDR1A; Multidrug resistance protein 3; P-glycoprotein 3